MKANREFILKAGIAVAVALWALDAFIIEPGIARWKDQGERITKLRAEVRDGDKMLGREQALRDHWSGMVHENLPADDTAAQNLILKAVSRWEATSRVIMPILNRDPRWKTNDDGSQTLEFHMTITGDQVSIWRFIYEAQTDKIPVYLKQYNLTSHDTRGTQLTMAATFSFLRLPNAR